VLALLVRLEQDARELSSKVSLPHSGVLWRYKINFVDHQQDLFASGEYLRFKLLAPAPFWVSGVQDLDDDV